MSIDFLELGGLHRGWLPVTHFAHLSARLTNGTALRQPDLNAGLLTRATRYLGSHRRDQAPHGKKLLVIARGPAQLRKGTIPHAILRQYESVAIWVVDSFWHNHIPRKLKQYNYDFIAVTRPNDLEVYTRIYGQRVICLPWGTDALDLGSFSSSREIDVLRVGRQAKAWDNDDTVAKACINHGLSHHGRPAANGNNWCEDYRSLLSIMGRSKFLIANSNLATPAAYTHPTEEYLTARWTDALAAGSVVAGIPPLSDQSSNCLWPGALLSFKTLDLNSGLADIAQAKTTWDWQWSLRNHRNALVNLDWRWRLQSLLQYWQHDSPELDDEISRLQNRISELDVLASKAKSGV